MAASSGRESGPAPAGTGGGYCRTGLRRSEAGSSRLGALGVAAASSARVDLVLDLADGLRRAAQRRGAASRAVGGDEAEQEDDRLAGDSSRTITANSRPTLTRSASPRPTLSGVRTMTTTRTTSWNRKQPRPGPRSASSGVALVLRSGAGRTVTSAELLRDRRSSAVGRGDDRGSAASRPRTIRRCPTDRRARRAERFAWHPEPELIGVRRRGASRAGAASGSGARRWEAALDYLYDHAFVRAMGEPAGYAELRADVLRADAASPAPAPARPDDAPADLLDEFRTRVAPHTAQRLPPALAQLLHAAAAARMSVVGELLAQVTQQGVDVWHAGPIGAFVEEEVVRWLCDLVGYGAGSFGLLTSGGVMANFIAMALVRDVHLAAAPRADAARRAGAALEGVRVYTSDQTHFSIAPGARRARLPGRHARRRPGRRPLPAPRARRSPRRSPRDRAAGPDAARDLGGRGLDEHGLGRPASSELADARRARGPVAPRRRGVRRGGPPLRRATRAASPASSGPTRSRSTRTSGSSRPTTSAGCGPRRARSSSGRSAAAGPSTTAAARRRRGDRATRRRRPRRAGPAQLLQARLRGHAPLAGAEAVAELEARRDERVRAARRGERSTWPRYLARRCAESDDFEALPAEPELSVVCFRHLPGGRRGARRARAGRPRRPPGSAPGRARGLRRRLALDDAPARRDLAAGRDRQHPHDRRRHRPLLRRSGGSRREGLTRERRLPLWPS